MGLIMLEVIKRPFGYVPASQPSTLLALFLSHLLEVENKTWMLDPHYLKGAFCTRINSLPVLTRQIPRNSGTYRCYFSGPQVQLERTNPRRYLSCT